jgi:hypothetical protein
MVLEPPSRPREGITMDFVTDWPETTASAYMGILVNVNRLTKIVIYLACEKEHDLPQLARVVFEHIICHHGIPDSIITNCSIQLTSQCWMRVCFHLSIDHRLSTAFHLQTDSQTECENQMMEQYLRAFCNY